VDSNATHQDLVSLAIKINPTLIARADRIGLANQNSPFPDECAIAAQALDRVSKQLDADGILSGNQEIMNEMVKMSAILLEEARYDIEEYSAWANPLKAAPSA
jgi:hypothetical protein